MVRPDGLPLIAYRDRVDRAVKLLDCRTRDCSRADTITVSDSGPSGRPAMVLDRHGRALDLMMTRLLTVR